jgi:hypothetical protein
MNMDPNKVLIETAERAFWRGNFEKNARRDPGKPGEFFNSLPEHEKEALRRLKSSDVNVRFDAIKFML